MILLHDIAISLKASLRIQHTQFTGHKTDPLKSVHGDHMLDNCLRGLYIINDNTIAFLLLFAEIDDRLPVVLFEILGQFLIKSGQFKRICSKNHALILFQIRNLHDALLSLCIDEIVSVNAKVHKDVQLIASLFGLFLESLCNLNLILYEQLSGKERNFLHNETPFISHSLVKC